MTTIDNPKVSPSSGKDDNLKEKGFLNRSGASNKTLWDWLQLLSVLAVPLVVAGATLFFGIQQANLANQQHDNDQKIASQQREADRQQTLDQQRQATLVAYQDNMKDLLLHQGLLTSKPTDEIRVVARTETLSAMRQLDQKRNKFLVQFLQDAHLVGLDSGNIVNFRNADLSSADLGRANLGGADLSGANLFGANLSGVILFRANLGANFGRANLGRADLSFASLAEADLSGASLSFANLHHAYLRDANLRDVALARSDLSGADLSRADLSSVRYFTQQQLDQVSSCKYALLPPGLTCHHNL